MILFSCTALPLSYLAISSLLRHTDYEVGELAPPFGAGAVALIPSLLVLWIVSLMFPEQYSRLGMYLHTLLLTHLFPSALASGAAYLYYIRISNDRRDLQFKITGFFSGFFTFLTLLEWLFGYERAGAYGAFLLPFARMALVLSIPPLIAGGFQSRGIAMVLRFVAAGFVTTVSALASWMFLMSRPGTAFIVLLFIVPASVLASVLASRNG